MECPINLCPKGKRKPGEARGSDTVRKRAHALVLFNVPEPLYAKM